MLGFAVGFQDSADAVPFIEGSIVEKDIVWDLGNVKK